MNTREQAHLLAQLDIAAASVEALRSAVDVCFPHRDITALAERVQEDLNRFQYMVRTMDEVRKA